MGSAYYDCASAILLCAEDNRSILGLDDEDAPAGFHLQTEECLAMLVLREHHHLPREDYATRLQTGALDLSLRRDAIDWICKVHAHYSFGPLSGYLSVNYLDRFLSLYELPQGKAWMIQLLSVACLSLAAKMEEAEVGDAKFVFEARTIQRMELLAVTPFSFLDYFLRSFNGGKSPGEASISRSVDLILRTTRGIDFLEFRPSEIAAAVAISELEAAAEEEVSGALLSRCVHLDKERVLRCLELLRDAAAPGNRPSKDGAAAAAAGSGAPGSVPQSPIGVLDAACLSYKSDDTTAGSQSIPEQNSPEPKRKKNPDPSEV
ncbi:unnamed protein product [Spirodela intermedia]|uniref:Uncharacterized protein n=1 Tax=Spirodela intermedia TaxID=51605 RepID=A0A7I8IQR5_SPIIN|nr:unnamed protein product [Spirodela intermedia]CAA6659482.1 unnamed protein product [Spirodela intermedia]